MGFLHIFDREFSQGLGVRAYSFRRVFELLEALHSAPYTIVETGVTNLPVPPLPWKTPSPHGHSTVLFQHFVSHHGGRLYSVDLNREYCAAAADYANEHVEVVCGDSRTFLRQHRFQSPINCLYLDSLDIDWRNAHVSALHHFQELHAALRKLAPRSIVVVDDTPHLQGKGGYISDYMERMGAQLLFENYQAGWLLPEEFSAPPAFCVPEKSLSECVAQINATRWFRYVREGYDQRMLELCDDHTIGEGKADCEERWFLESNGSSATLVLVGQGQVTCRFEQSRDGVWKGRWIKGERMPVTLTAHDVGRDRQLLLAGTWKLVLESGVVQRIEMMPSGNIGFGGSLLEGTWTVDPADNVVVNGETRFQLSSDKVQARCVASHTHLKNSTLVRCEPLDFVTRRLHELVANLTWFDIAIEPDHWPMEFLQNGAIGAGRSSQFQSWDIEELDGTIYLVLSNKIDVKRFRCDQSSGGSLKFVCKNDGTTLRHLVPAGGAYLLPYFTAAIPHAKIRTIVEIGCADGADSIALQRYYEADVFAFECHPDYARFCRLKVAGNKRVRFYETGISEQTSDAHDFYVSDGKNPAASSFFIANPRYPYESYEQRPIKVATTTLDEWSLDAGVECIDLLCMDCQGSTLAALRGGTDILSRTQFILAQLGTRPIYQNEPLAAEIVKMLSERGFQLIRSLNQWGVTNSGTFCNHPNYDRRYQHLESWFGGFLFKGMSDGERSLAREIISQRYFLYKRVGYDQRLIELLPDGRIGVGAAEFELNWMVQDQADGDTHLLILGLNHVTCRLVQKSPGLFIGRWLLYEQMPIELVNAAGPNNAPVRLPLDVGYAQGQFSQQGEDNTLLFILAQIKGSINRTFVEIGVGPRYGFDPNNCDLECNCRALRERGWRGWMFDRNQYPDDCEVIQEHFSAANAVEIFERHKIPEQIDVLSIDIDGQDYWVWRALGARARIVCIEYNCSIGGLQVVPEMPDFSWDGTNYYGASLDAMNALGKQLGYVLIYTNNVNAFFIQRKLISNPDEFRETTAAPVVPLHPVDSSGRPWLNPNTI